MPCFELNHIVSYIWSQPLFVRSGGRMWDRMILQSKYLYACYDAHRNKKGVGSLENCRKFVWSPITSWLQSGFIEYGTGCFEDVFFFFEQDWCWSDFGKGKKHDSISSLAHDVSVSVQTSEPKHILFFSHGSLALRCCLVILSAMATLPAPSTGLFVPGMWFFCFSKFIHCFSSPSSSSVLFFCKWLQAVDSIFPKPLTYNLIFDVHPIILLQKK